MAGPLASFSNALADFKAKTMAAIASVRTGGGPGTAAPPVWDLDDATLKDLVKGSLIPLKGSAGAMGVVPVRRSLVRHTAPASKTLCVATESATAPERDEAWLEANIDDTFYPGVLTLEGGAGGNGGARVQV